MGSSRTYNNLEQTAMSGNRLISTANYTAYSRQEQNDDAKSMTSLDLNHPRQV